MKRRKKVIKILVLLAVVGIIGTVFVMSGIYDPDNRILGNNQNVTWYSRTIGTEAYAAIEDAVKSHDENYNKEKMLYTLHTGNVAEVFMLNGNEVTGYEFIIKDEKYHYIGERKLIINGGASVKEYDWEMTLRSDLSYSTGKSYKNITSVGTKYSVLPAWGISDREQVRNVTFDGQAVDEVIPFSDEQGTYYLWIIHDLQTKNDAVDVVIEYPEEGTEKLSEKENEQELVTSPPVIINPEGNTLQERIAPPPGYERTEESEDSLAVFLRGYPLKKAGEPVLLYNGEQKGNRDAHVAVFKLPLEKEDLQQCADTVMRVYAEYFWETGQKERISFQFVDGFQAQYTKWRDGYRIRSGDAGSSWVSGGTYDDSYKNFKKYLRMVFAYAGTLSMEKESKKVKLSKVAAGDIFLNAGSPGHVVMVVDVCESADGKKAFLLGQGYMPAQEFHLLKNPSHEDDPWYYVDEISYPLWTPEYSFQKGSFRRLDY